jgi:hypothetical protein
MREEFERGIRDIEIAMALVDVARAAQRLRDNHTLELLTELFEALEQWEKLTNQEGVVT